MDKIKIDKKKYLSILIIFATILVISIIGTYALKLWSSTNNTELTFKVGEYDLGSMVCRNSDDVTISNMGPIFDYNKDGEVINFKVLAKSDNTNSLNIYFNITTISDSLKDASFKYVLLSSTDNKNFTEELKGNFLNSSNGDSLTLVEDKVITTNTNYKLIIYIDGNMENPIDMRSSSLSGNIEMCAENADFVLNSFKVNGTEVTTFPLASAYTIDTTCSDADISFDYKSQSYIVSNINKNSKAKCGINYTTNSSLTNLNSHIISLAGTINDNGGVVNENGYRYEGKNPNNYIYFNNELWRIIGVFDSASHGVTNSNLTKIIRNESIGGLVWDKSSSNNWASSSLYNLLNNNYYNKTDGTSSGNCYQYSTSVGGNCDYSYIGLSSEYRNMVQSVTWYLGGKDSTSYTANDFYTSERDSSAIYGSNSGAVTNYIGLMYASDYGYSPLSSNCVRTTNFGSYGSSSCAGSSWLKKETYEWTITPNSSSSNAFYVDYSGNLNDYNPSYGFAARPVLYLKSDVKTYAGEGTLLNPYIIKYESE